MQASLRDEVKVIASGKVLTGFSLVKTLAVGADVCNSARGMMFALGCIQVRSRELQLLNYQSILSIVLFA